MTPKPADKRPMVTYDMIREDLASSGRSLPPMQPCSGNCAQCPCSDPNSGVNRLLDDQLGSKEPRKK